MISFLKTALQRQAELWKDQDQHESWLLRDQALVEVEQWAKEHQDELTDVERDFLTACQKMQAQIEERHAAERNRLEMANKLAEELARAAKRARIFNIVSVVLVVIAIFTSIYAFREQKNAKSQAEKALIAQNKAQAGELSTIALERSEQFDRPGSFIGAASKFFRQQCPDAKSHAGPFA